jgi:predicted kinase
MSTFVVVSGLPASGKTTLAAALAEEIAAPHLDKDVFLEALFDREGASDSESRQKLSRRADEEFQSQALKQPLAVLSSWWRHPGGHPNSPTDGHLKLPHLS